jgi:hypothetical protein
VLQTPPVLFGSVPALIAGLVPAQAQFASALARFALQVLGLFVVTAQNLFASTLVLLEGPDLFGPTSDPDAIIVTDAPNP